MAQDPNDNNEVKGFSGLESMVSDVSGEVRQNSESLPDKKQPSVTSSETDKLSDSSQPVHSNPVQSHPSSQASQTSCSQSSAASSGSSGTKWIFGLIVLFFVIWFIENSDKKSGPTHSPPAKNNIPISEPIASMLPTPEGITSIPPDQPIIAEKKPPIGKNFILDRNQIRYCLIEKTRIDAIEEIINVSRKKEVDQFNTKITDYNRRCGEFRYRQSTLERVRSEVNLKQEEIIQKTQSVWQMNFTDIDSPVSPETIYTKAKDNIPVKFPYSSNSENPRELILLALKYEHAEGVPRNNAKAATLYCKAAKMGNADAQFFLGWMYANGRGVSRNDSIASYLFSLAAKQGHVHAKKMGRYTKDAAALSFPSC